MAEKPKATVVGKPFCPSCLQAEHDLTELGFDVLFLNAGTADGMAWLAERGYPLDETLTVPKIELDGWPVKGTEANQ